MISNINNNEQRPSFEKKHFEIQEEEKFLAEQVTLKG